MSTLAEARALLLSMYPDLKPKRRPRAKHPAKPGRPKKALGVQPVIPDASVNEREFVRLAVQQDMPTAIQRMVNGEQLHMTCSFPDFKYLRAKLTGVNAVQKSSGFEPAYRLQRTLNGLLITKL